MITPSFSLTATERVLPRLALDFTTASLDARITFSRTTGAINPATYVDSSGIVVLAANNQPRFDFDPITLACKGLLIEESRVNLCTYSQDFSNWLMSSTTFALNVTNAAPDGTFSAYDIQSSATTGRAFQPITSFTGNGTKTISVFFRKGTSNTFRLAIRDASANAYVGRALVDLSGAVPSATLDIGTGTVFPIQTFNNGWFRLSVALDNVIAANANQIWVLPSAGAINTTLTVWGAQAENGAFATSYIPTTTTALTRNADVATMTGTNFSDWFNASEGTFSTQVINTGLTALNLRSLSVVSATDGFWLTSSATNTARLRVNVSGSYTASITATVPTTGVVKAAGSYKLDSMNFAAASNLGTPDTLSGVPALDNMRIGFETINNSYCNTHVQKVLYYPQQLTNAELQAITK